MNTSLLETLVKLASLGASGICIFAIFWIGWLISRTPSGADPERHRTMRQFMAMCVAIAIIAGVTGYMTAQFRSETAEELFGKLDAANKTVQKHRELQSAAHAAVEMLEDTLRTKEIAAAADGSDEIRRQVKQLKESINRLKGKLDPKPAN